MSRQELFNKNYPTPENHPKKSLRINYEDNRLTTIINKCCDFIKEGRDVFESETQKKLENKLMEEGIITGYLEVLDGRMWDLPKEIQQTIKDRLNEFEKNMQFDYVDGIVDFIGDLKRNGIKCAVVTSSNRNKMKNVYDQHPEYFQEY